jgi:hypothetical protein
MFCFVPLRSRPEAVISEEKNQNIMRDFFSCKSKDKKLKKH